MNVYDKICQNALTGIYTTKADCEILHLNRGPFRDQFLGALGPEVMLRRAASGPDDVGMLAYTIGRYILPSTGVIHNASDNLRDYRF